MTYTISPTALMILDEGAPVKVKGVRMTVGPGHYLWAVCGREARRVRVVEVGGGGHKPRWARVEVPDE